MMKQFNSRQTRRVKQILTLTFTIGLFLSAYCQTKRNGNKRLNKLVLCKGANMVSIEEGQLLGITQVGENYKYTDWANICKCDNSIRQNFWIVDSIGHESISLVTFKYKQSFTLDTIPGNKNIPKNKDYEFQKTLPSKTKKQKFYDVVYKVPILEVSIDKHIIVKYGSIESFTFSKADLNKCGTKMEKIHFDYSWANQSGAKKGAVAIIILATFSGVIVESVVNSTITVTEKVTDKREKLLRYKLNEWKIKLR